jgi:hypothetical protein
MVWTAIRLQEIGVGDAVAMRPCIRPGAARAWWKAGLGRRIPPGSRATGIQRLMEAPVPVRVTDIVEIKQIPRDGYVISFRDGRTIRMSKARAIVALLVLLQNGEARERDLTEGSESLAALRKTLKGKIPEKLIREFYRDANKPFSELWNEEGFAFMRPPTAKRAKRSQVYTLLESDHELLFLPVEKAVRKAPSKSTIANISQRKDGHCNLCAAILVEQDDVLAKAFCRDRQTRCYDHRMPVQQHPGAGSDSDNYQMLCFYCNKSKWQICHTCVDSQCINCALAFPEISTIVFPTGEDISDRMG